jgi:hypothetical protein
VIIAAVEHQVGALRSLKLGVGSVLTDQQIGRTPNVEIRDRRVAPQFEL